MNSFKKIIFIVLSFSFFSQAFAADANVNVLPSLVTIINKTQIPLIMICGTASKAGYLQHSFINQNDPGTKQWQVNDGLFLNENDPVTCAIYKVNNLASAPHNYSLEINFSLVPEKRGEQVRVKAYVEQQSSLEVLTNYQLDSEKGSLTVTLTPAVVDKENIQYPSQLVPVPR